MTPQTNPNGLSLEVSNSRIPKRIAPHSGVSAFVLAAGAIFCLLAPALALPGLAQTAESETAMPVSPLTAMSVIRWNGTLPEAAGQTVELRFTIYEYQSGGPALGTETQTVKVSSDGGYSVLLGAMSPDGLPKTLFQSVSARWIEAKLAIAGNEAAEVASTQPRSLLASVPYAMKSADAEALAGHPVADFVTQEQLSALQGVSSGAGPSPITGFTSGPITGSGTAGSFAQWTGTNTIGPSLLYQGPLGFGIKIPSPVTTLEVGGNTTDDGYLVMAPFSTATTTAGGRSNLIEFSSSVWSAAANAAGTQNFRIFANPVGNNTASPSAALQFQFEPGTGTATNILSIDNTGNIHFSPTQTFPITGTGGGTITGITTTSPLTGAGTAGSVALGLNTAALETTLNSVYPQLGTSNVFKSFLEAYQTAGPGDAALLGWGSNGSVGTFGSSDSGFGVEGTSTTGNGVEGISRTPAVGAAAVFGVTGTSYSNTYVADGTGLIASVWGDTAGVDSGAGQYAAVIGTADSGSAAFFNNNSHSVAAVDVVNANGTGILAFDDVPAVQEGAIVGTAGGTNSGEFGNYFLSAGVWGDTSGTPSSAYWVGGILGTADNAFGGLFYNDSASWPTVYAQNDGSDGTGLFTTVMAVSKGGTCGIGGHGDLTCTGQVKSLVSTGGGARKVETYAMQSPENWMEDFGSGELHNGVAVVRIEAAFGETVSETADYHVFLTPKADSKGLYVINETPTSFEVRESGGGTSSLSFDYRIVAKRRGFEAQRLVDVTDRYNAEQRAATLPRNPNPKLTPTPELPAIAALHSKSLRPGPSHLSVPSRTTLPRSTTTHP